MDPDGQQHRRPSLDDGEYNPQQLIHDLNASSDVDPYWSFQQSEPGHDEYYPDSATANLVHGLDLAAAAAEAGNDDREPFFPHLVQEQEQDVDMVELDRPSSKAGMSSSSPSVSRQLGISQNAEAGPSRPSTASGSGSSGPIGTPVSRAMSVAATEQDMKRKRGRPIGSKTVKRKGDSGASIIRTKPPLRPATDLMPVLGRKHALGAAGGAGYLTRPVGLPKAKVLVNSQEHQVVPRPMAQPVYHPPPVPVPSPARPATSPPTNAQADQHQQSLLRFNHDVLLAASRFYAEVAGIVARTPAPVLHQALETTPGGSRSGVLGVLSQAKDVCEGLIADDAKLNATTRPPPAYSQQPRYHIMPPSAYAPLNGMIPAPIQQQLEMQHRGMAMHHLAGQRPAPVGFQPGMATQEPYGYGMPYNYDYNQHPQGHPPSASAPGAPLTSKPPAPEIPSDIPDISEMPSAPAYLHGSWQPVEVERLRVLAMASADASDKREVDWDWVTTQFGSARSRHQVLIKAVQLGLKETTTHPSRRRPKTLNPQNEGEGGRVEKVSVSGGLYDPMLNMNEADMLQMYSGGID